MGFLDGIGETLGLGGETTEDPTTEDPTAITDTEDTTTSGTSSGKTEEQKKAEEYQAKISDDRDGYILHQGEILETHTYDKIYNASWNKDYEGISGDGSITIPFHKDDLNYIYKGVRCLLKNQRFEYDDDKIEIDDSEGYLCFITDVNINNGRELELSLSGFEKLLEQENILSFTGQRRSVILAEVIKMAGLVPVIDTEGLADEVINWSTEKSKGKDSDGSGGDSATSVNGDGSMTEDEAWEIASSWGYAGIGTNHDPQKAWDMMGTTKGKNPDCYDATAWLYYVFNTKVGIPARDICYHSDYASSGSHHTIQLYRNGKWEDPSEYKSMHKYLGVISSRDKSKDHICREPPKDGKIPPYSRCPHSNNG